MPPFATVFATSAAASGETGRVRKKTPAPEAIRSSAPTASATFPPAPPGLAFSGIAPAGFALVLTDGVYHSGVGIAQPGKLQMSETRADPTAQSAQRVSDRP